MIAAPLRERALTRCRYSVAAAAGPGSVLWRAKHASEAARGGSTATRAAAAPARSPQRPARSVAERGQPSRPHDRRALPRSGACRSPLFSPRGGRRGAAARARLPATPGRARCADPTSGRSRCSWERRASRGAEAAPRVAPLARAPALRHSGRRPLEPRGARAAVLDRREARPRGAHPRGAERAVLRATFGRDLASRPRTAARAVHGRHRGRRGAWRAAKSATQAARADPLRGRAGDEEGDVLRVRRRGEAHRADGMRPGGRRVRLSRAPRGGRRRAGATNRRGIGGARCGPGAVGAKRPAEVGGPRRALRAPRRHGVAAGARCRRARLAHHDSH